MTLQKAMRVRSEIKKEIGNLQDLLYSNPYIVTFTQNKPTEKELTDARSEKTNKLDGMSYDEVVKKIFRLTDVCLELNVAIEQANKEGHELLFKEAAYKSKLAMLDNMIDSERSIVSEEEILDTDYNIQDEKGNFKKVKVMTYNYPILTDKTFGMSLTAYRKQLNKELEEVRDNLSAFNASKKIDYELPDDVC